MGFFSAGTMINLSSLEHSQRRFSMDEALTELREARRLDGTNSTVQEKLVQYKACRNAHLASRRARREGASARQDRIIEGKPDPSSYFRIYSSNSVNQWINIE